MKVYSEPYGKKWAVRVLGAPARTIFDRERDAWVAACSIARANRGVAFRHKSGLLLESRSFR